jgi:hypothetical protein
MPTSREVAQQHRAERVRLATATAAAGAALWDEVDEGDLSRSWAERLRRLLTILTGAQLSAARQADGYIGRVLQVRGADAPPVGEIQPDAFSGVASDGRSLLSLLEAPVTATKTAIARGATVERAKATGTVTLDMLLRTQVADAGRVADGVAMAIRPKITGYERVVHLPACGRCIILAGRLYRWSTGFQRHPRCDCTMEPVTSDEWRTERPENEPKRLFEQMTPEQRGKAFTKAGAQAIADGADPSQVANARRGMSPAGATTTEGVTRRGIAGARLITGDATAFTAPRDNPTGTQVVSTFRRQTRRGQQTVRLRGAQRARLMPEQIYREATSRDEALQLLRLHGYIL